MVQAKLEGAGDICKATIKRFRNQSTKSLCADSTLSGKLSATVALGHCKIQLCECCGVKAGECTKQQIEASFCLRPRLTVIRSLRHKLEGIATLSIPYTDKFAGDFSDNASCHKMYPITDLDSTGIINETVQSSPLYPSIDEGVFTGFYHTPSGHSNRISDGNETFIQPSSVVTEGSFFYKCEVTKPATWLKDSRVHFRAAAPLKNNQSAGAPEYTIRDIKLEDPSGNLISHYEDIVIRGDADLYKADPVNFATYSSKPQRNHAGAYQWNSGIYPLLQEASGYTLRFNVDSKSLDDPFDQGFNPGFEEESSPLYETTIAENDHLAIDGTPLSTRSSVFVNPLRAIRISAVEIASFSSDGYCGFGPAREDKLGLFVDVTPTGQRMERVIYPIEFKPSGFDTGIYPAKDTLWKGINSDVGISTQNTDNCKAAALKDMIRNRNTWEYISLDSIPAVSESGKLTLKFGHEVPRPIISYGNGAFSIGVFPSGDFDTAYQQTTYPIDNFFPIDSVYLKVYARKANGAADYPIDVVGYSDDKLLRVTSAIGGFLQNPSGDTGLIPVSSGFNPVDDLAIDGESLSDKSQYFESSGTNNAGGDHYLVSSNVVTNSGEFKWYEVPLEIYPDKVQVGPIFDYKQSSYFENIYLDIYPLPSGAEICAMELVVKYKPANAMQMYTVGGKDFGVARSPREELKLYPSSRQTSDSIINAGSGYAPISTISGIPQAYTAPDTIKSNYARRWRGMEGTVNGPYDPNEFSFGFENPLVDFPFLSGYFDFDYDVGKTILSRPLGDELGNLSGTLTTSYADYRHKNIGWRFTSGVLFTDKLPGYSGNYETTDWTSLASGSQDFTGHELYGQISDAFNNVVRLSGVNSSINFGPVDFSGGFSVFTRFTPDCDMSGVGYNLWDSGVLVSKWDAGKGLDFALGYESGYLCGFATEKVTGTVIKVKDTLSYDQYQYPLSVILTYNDHESSGLKLYTDNEFYDGEFTTLRGSSAAFEIDPTGTGSLVLGYSAGSGVGSNIFVSEFGYSAYGAGVSGMLSSGTNIVQSGANLRNKEVTAQKFLENHRMKFWDAEDATSDDSFKLWDYVNEDTTKWDLGAFKYCEFSPDFDFMTTRIGRDLIGFNIVHEGSGYTQKTNIADPDSLSLSGISYHTQIENDFLRFNLSDTSSSFYSLAPRISKALPRGYNFKEDAIVVDSVLEHTSSGSMNWGDCAKTTGPKLIVSLYTRKKDPYWASSTSNFGLINRAIHYLPASSCFEKIESRFDFDSFTDESESWSLFPQAKRVSEFDHKYYSEDIDKMFLQYDLVYPSGSEFKSRINLHSAHVRLVDPLIGYTDVSGILNLAVSGEPRNAQQLNLAMLAHSGVSGSLNLYVSGVTNLPTTQLGLYTSGAYISYGSLPLFTTNYESTSGSLNLYTSGNYRVDESLNLTAFNDQYWSPSPSSLNLSMFGCSTGYTGMFSESNLFLQADTFVPSFGLLASGMNMFTKGKPGRFSSYSDASTSLFIAAPNIVSSTLPLYMPGKLKPGTVVSDSFSLFTANYAGVGTPAFSWDGANYQSGIIVAAEAQDDDEFYTSVAASDEIRGVDLIGFGSCNSDSPGKIISPPLNSHGTDWRAGTCTDAGIFRAHSTYTNVDIGYSGNYYGIRKYQKLKPDTLYNVTIQGRSGSSKRIELPRKWEEWEYGICGPGYNALSCCGDTGCEDNLAFSGVKMVGDYPYLSGQLSLTPDSGRNVGDKYGHSVAVDNGWMAIGAPFHTVGSDGAAFPAEEGSGMERAGAVFLYKRQDQEYGGQKAPWHMHQKLLLPSGFRGEYYKQLTTGSISFGDLDVIPDRKWEIGQRGRELGYSLDVTDGSGDAPRQVVVIGAPGAKFDRTFPDIITSGIPVGVLVISDEFSYEDKKGNDIYDKITYWNKLYRYYASHPAEIDLKVVVCQPTGIFGGSINQTGNLPDFITHKKVGRNNIGVTDAEILSGIQTAFHQAFPYDASKAHNNIPVMLGVYVDESRSLGRDAMEPAIDQFKGYYEQYSYLSGVRDFYGTQDKGHLFEFVPGSVDDEYPEETANLEDWVGMSKKIIDELMDSGRLVRDDGLRFITSGVGPQFAQVDTGPFNIPANSGGRVYVFENEANDTFSLIQEIKSPTEGPWHIPDRFGHAVSISKDSNMITIGSPYMANSCAAYEYYPKERSKLYKGLGGWLAQEEVSLPGSVTDEIAKLDRYQDQLGVEEGGKKFYEELSASGKFHARSDLNIEEYKQVFAYGHDSIPYTGTWSFVAEEYAPTSRLGYSTAVSEAGSTLAFGAPTDSFNQFDDYNVWYYSTGDTKDGNLLSANWANASNAGAVRIFDSRKYYQHSGVVEFTKFGNLDRNAHIVNGVEGDHYEDLEDVFTGDKADAVRPFSRTSYTDLEIPTDAGLAFVITPQIDAASDEVMDNIKSWLALGDRTLVLVGNDPVWEDNGRYKNSNAILNKILSKLDSRMRIHPARNKAESLPVCAEDGKPNVTAAYRPVGARSTRLERSDIYAKGVGDIRMYMPDFKTMASPCESPLEPYSNQTLLNERCNMWLQHEGDMRAEWNESCRSGKDCDRNLAYQRNWPMEFGTYAPNCCYPEPIPEIQVKKPNQEPLALLTAAEYIPEKTEIFPPTLGTKKECTSYYKTIKKNTKYKEFADNHTESVSFEWSENNLDAVSTSEGLFDNPEIFESRDSLLSKTSQIRELNPVTKYKDLLNPLPLVGQEVVYNTSKVVMIATLISENEESLTAGNDETISFYLNLVQQDCYEKGRILQLGGWTGRTKFTEAYSKSLLSRLFTVTGNNLQENWTHNLHSSYNAAWVANATGLPSESQAADIKHWLSTGNKTLVITYDGTLASARNAHNICRMLDLSMHPVFSELENKYKYTTLTHDSSYLLDADNPLIAGCNDKSEVSKFTIKDKTDDLQSLTKYYPIQNSAKVIWLPGRIRERYEVSNSEYYMRTGVAEAKFDVVAGSGYRIFYSWVSETPNESRLLNFYVDGVSENPNDATESDGKVEVKDMDSDFNMSAKYSANSQREMTPPGVLGSIKRGYVDVKVPDDATEINIYVEGNEIPTPSGENGPLKTTRFFAVSGCPLPILEKTSSYEFEQFSHEVCEEIPVTNPGYTVTHPAVFRPIKTDHSKYCSADDCLTTYGDKEVEDGPIVVAEETEHFSSFTAGEKRSTIIVISDSTIVQGECGFYRTNNADFLRSLYPPNPLTEEGTDSTGGVIAEEVDLYDEGTLFQGSRFTLSQKLIAPDRGSPHKFRAAGAHLESINAAGSGLIAKRFKGDSYSPVAMSSFTDTESDYTTGDITRPEDPEPEQRPAALQAFLESFAGYGGSPLFSGGIEGYEDYGDARIAGDRMPRIMKETGYDYLDFDQWPSGYPGDLFGFSIDLHKDRLIVGAPFNGFDGEDHISWSGIQENPSGLKISGNGGAGAAYYFEKTGKGYNAESSLLPWEYIKKFKPSGVNAGYDGWTDASNPDADDVLGTNDYAAIHLADAYITDQFGYDVSMDEGFMAIGAPGHDFDVFHEHMYERTVDGISYSGAFMRKEFDFEFDIPLHNTYDLGSSGMRDSVPSGYPVLNNGAVFTYVYDIIDSGQKHVFDYANKEKMWQYAEKVLPQGHGARSGVYAYDDGGDTVFVSGSENDHFGRSVAIDRVYDRGDADYTLVGGAVRHRHGASGTSDVLVNAGAAYTYDAMLRRSAPAVGSDQNYIVATVGLTGSGGLETERISLTVNQSGGGDTSYKASGNVMTNPQGEIFLEASGYDPALNGFPEHRSFIEYVKGEVVTGPSTSGVLGLYIDPAIPQASSIMNMSILSQSSAYVYNNIGLYTNAILGRASGEPSGLFLHTIHDPVAASGSLGLFASGVGTPEGSLYLAIRGK
tara:strand:+ start:2969 stop:14563 length:11595 start_codon:yes stop_codon:yes gene_type:complete